ncbi:hemicentin-1-like isoform X1 [Haliotis cracherodii]|uniref:hemicentin-1-like isoform X1 n=1 Tax=Haliotis cracherodii TaxID=6455 RepID=UPI0039E940C1
MEMTTAFLLSTLCTFLMSCVGQDTSMALPEFVTHPQEYSYIVKHQPVTLTCEAYDAMEITFNCLGMKMDTERMKTYESFEPESGRILIKATFDVTENDVRGMEDYWCECQAWNGLVEGGEAAQQFTVSRRGFVMSPYLGKYFVEEPLSQSVEEDSSVELICIPPEGHPEPKIIWKKNGHRLHPDKDDNLLITESRSLVIQNFQMTDEGDYSCVAKNLAGKVESNVASLTLQDYIVAGETNLLMADEADEEIASFLQVPEAEYYTTKDTPAAVTCSVKGAELLEFRCNGARIDEKLIEKDVTNPRGGPERLITSIYKVPADAVTKGRDYTCLCYAWFMTDAGWSGKETTPGNVMLGELDERFGSELQDMTVAPGSTVTFRCQAPRGVPAPRIIWTLNNQQLGASASVEITDNSLMIKQVSSRYEGQISCVAQNVAGTRRTTATLKLSEDAEMVDSSKETTDFPTTLMTTPPSGTGYFNQDLEEVYYAARRRPAELSCTYIGANLLTVRCNGNRLAADRVTTKEDVINGEKSITGTVQVRLQEVRGASADFSCMCVAWVAKGGSWSTTEGQRSVIKEAFLDKAFLVEPQNVEVMVGRTAVFDCVPPQGGPDPQVYWTKDGQRVDTSNENYELVADGSLTIFTVRKEDIGAYTCVAENTASATASSAALLSVIGDSTDVMEPETTITPQPETTEEMMEETTTEVDLSSPIPIFIRKPEPVYYIVRERPASITCRTLGAEYLIFECNGARLPEKFNETYSAIDPETRKKILERTVNIDRKTVDAVDNYTCQCSAWYADAVKQGWSMLNMPTRVEIAYLKKRFQKDPPKSQKVDAGSTVELACMPPVGNPTPTVSWLFDGDAVDAEDENIIVSSEGSLIINEAQMTNDGNYTCVAENVYGKRYSKSGVIRVMGDEPTPEPTDGTDVGVFISSEVPTFTQELNETIFVVDEKATLTCAAMQTGKITFLCNNEEVAEERITYRNEKSDDGEMVLVASMDVMADSIIDISEEYACECLAWYKLSDNEPEQSVNSRRGRVEIAYLQDDFVLEPSSKTVKMDTMVTLQCVSPDGFPRPVISWFFNGKLLDFNANDNLLYSREQSIVILQVGEKDAGSYSCEASNIAGTRRSGEATLTVVGDSTTSMPEPEPETTAEIFEGNFTTEDATYVTSDIMPSAEYTTESIQEGNMVENTTMYYEIGTDGHITDEGTPEPEPEGNGNNQGIMFPHPECGKLQACYQSFLPTFSPNNFKTHKSCDQLQQFFTCAHDALMMCGINTDQQQATLADMAGWFDEYCTRLPRDDKVSMKCGSYGTCRPPVTVQTQPKDLIDVPMLCNYIHKTTECRQLALADSECMVMKKNKMKNDLHYLETQAQKYCPTGTTKDNEAEVTQAPVTGINVGKVEKEEPNGAASMTTASVLVSTIIQVLAILVISFR